MMSELHIIKPGICHYDTAMRLQRKLLEDLKSVQQPSRAYLILLQHQPVITIGRAGHLQNILLSPDDLQRRAIAIRESSRGGDVTYHAPGQLVGYPIISLRPYGRDVHAYMRRLESVIIDCLLSYRIHAQRVPGRTGVWVDNKKIASIGVAVSRWVAYHGFALNVTLDPREFEVIRACGLAGVQMTSMRDLLHQWVDIQEVGDTLVDCFRRQFGLLMTMPTSKSETGAGKRWN